MRPPHTMAALLLAAASTPALAGPLPPESFETGFAPWTMDSVVDGSLPFDPSITRTTENARTGQWSARYFAHGNNDDGVLWLERPVQLPAGTSDVTLSFWMWSPSQADIGTWEVVAYIGIPNPEEESDFTLVGYTHMAAGWFPYTHKRRITLAEPQTVWLAFGLSIIFEVDDTHDFDDVTIDITPVPCPADFDRDGFLTGLDFDAYIAAFESGDPSADFDGDGFITGLDFDAFVVAFEAGC